MKSPAFQFYPTDYLGSQRVQMLSLEEEGAYIRLICYCWQHGSIPADPDKCARLIGKGSSTTLARVVQAMFVNSDNPEELRHDRLDEQRDKQAAWKQKCSDGGKKSAESRSNSKGSSTNLPRVVEKYLELNGNIPTPIPTPTPTPTPIPDPIPDSSNSPEPKRRKKALPITDEWLTEIQAVYPYLSTSSEFAKAKLWCDAKNRSCSRAFLLNWLGRIPPPPTATGVKIIKTLN